MIVYCIPKNLRNSASPNCDNTILQTEKRYDLLSISKKIHTITKNDLQKTPRKEPRRKNLKEKLRDFKENKICKSCDTNPLFDNQIICESCHNNCDENCKPEVLM